MCPASSKIEEKHVNRTPRTVSPLPTRCAAEANSHPCADEAISRLAPMRRSSVTGHEPGLRASMVSGGLRQDSGFRQWQALANRLANAATAAAHTAAAAAAAVCASRATVPQLMRFAHRMPTNTPSTHRHTTPPLNATTSSRRWWQDPRAVRGRMQSHFSTRRGTLTLAMQRAAHAGARGAQATSALNAIPWHQ